jgi:hypothetical protein
VLIGEATIANCIVFGLTGPGLETTIYRTRGEHASITLPMRFEISEDNFIKHPIINVFFVDNVNETDKSAALKRTGCNSIGCSEPPSYPFTIPGCKTINCSLPPPPLPPIELPLRDDVMNIISSSDCKDDALSLFGLQKEHGVSINSRLKDDRSLMKMFTSGKDATSMGISQTIMSGSLVFKIIQFVLICMCITYPVEGVF